MGNVDRFFECHWSRAPLVRAPEQDAGAFDDLASLDDLDALIASSALHASGLRMVRDGKSLPVSAYISGPGKGSRGGDPLVSSALVYERFSEGATIVLESLHRRWAPLADFCRELEVSLGHRLQVNAYITPPGARGFDVHIDDHDVFVLQVSGAKHWFVYDRDDDGILLIDREIARGTALYIPTGFPHAASAQAGASAHLTVGILTHDSMDVVREITRMAQEEPAFQERLPAGAATDPESLRSAVEGALTELRVWLDKVDMDELTLRVARRVMTTSQPIVRGQLRQSALASTIGQDTELVRRRGAVCILFRGQTSVTVLLSDRELELPAAAEDPLRFIAARERFRVGDLHELLTPESALVLARRLVREGLLEVAVGR